MNSSDISSLTNQLHSSKKFLGLPDWQKRVQAAQQLGNLRAAAAVDDLRTVISEAKNEDLVLAAIRALGQIGDETAINALGGILTDRSSQAWHKEVVVVLSGVENPRVVTTLINAASMVSENIRRAMAQVLAKMSPAWATEPLRAYPTTHAARKVIQAQAK